MDIVSLERNIEEAARVLTAVEDVAVADLGVNQECWQVLYRALSREDKVLKRLEMSQLLCLDDTTIPLLCAGLTNVPQVRLAWSGQLPSQVWSYFANLFASKDGVSCENEVEARE